MTKLDGFRGKALSAVEKTAVTNAVTQTNNSANSIQDQFIGSAAKATGMDASILKAVFPSATQPVTNSQAVSSLESKLGGKLNFLQSGGVKAATALRNSSLDSLKTKLAGTVGKAVGMDGQAIAGLLPMLGF